MGSLDFHNTCKSIYCYSFKTLKLSADVKLLSNDHEMQCHGSICLLSLCVYYDLYGSVVNDLNGSLLHKDRLLGMSTNDRIGHKAPL